MLKCKLGKVVYAEVVDRKQRLKEKHAMLCTPNTHCTATQDSTNLNENISELTSYIFIKDLQNTVSYWVDVHLPG